MKRHISMLLVTAILIGTIGSNPNLLVASANSKSTNLSTEKVDIEASVDTILQDKSLSLTDNNLSTLVATAEKIASYGVFEPEQLIDINLNTDSTSLEAEYVIEYDEYINTVSIIEETSEKTVFKCSQDNIHNVVELYEDGTIILDGNEITYTSPIEETIEMDNLVVANDSQSWFTSSCPYGSASDYSHLFGSTNNPDIELTKSLVNIAVSALSLILDVAMQSAVPGFIVESLYNIFVGSNPNTTGLSCKLRKYTHASYTGGYVSPKRLTIIRYVYTWYAKVSYAGSTTTQTAYYCKEYY